MSLNARRGTYAALIVLAMGTTGWQVVYDLWRTVLGDDAGEAMARFWDLQVESYWNALLFVFILDFIYGMHRGADGGWGFAPASLKVRLATYSALVLLCIVCSAESPVRDVLQPLLGENVGASVAHYFRRALEGVMTTIGLMIFMDFVKPGRLSEVADKTPPSVASG